MKANSLNLIAIPDFPMVEPGDDLLDQIITACQQADEPITEGDVLVLAQKIVSKAEGRYARLAEVAPSAEAIALAQEIHKEPAIAQLILDESVAIVRKRPGVVIVEHKLGYVHANAGIDRSNIQSDADSERVLLLPLDSDASAKHLRDGIAAKLGVNVSVIINDSAGRAWRNGTLGFAIGTAGFEPVVDMVGEQDLFGRPLEVTEIAVADELAAAASFLMGQANEGCPLVLIRGAKLKSAEVGSGSLIRDRNMDMFR